MRLFNLQFRLMGDDRAWEKIPVENSEYLELEHPTEAITFVEHFIKIWNGLRRNETIKIQQVRISTEWYKEYRGQGYYVTDWSVYDSEH